MIPAAPAHVRITNLCVAMLRVLDDMRLPLDAWLRLSLGERARPSLADLGMADLLETATALAKEVFDKYPIPGDCPIDKAVVYDLVFALGDCGVKLTKMEPEKFEELVLKTRLDLLRLWPKEA
jgi:hypothetical protein